ncbi:MAG: tellurite resistance TerB family protein [Gammaproteobacteria bacterium]|nr:tellurite resistance TerB family protein [Gammaproteobacteria bacterium]
MANFGDLIGAFLQNSMASSGNRRIGSALENLQRGGLNIPGMGGSQGGGDLFGGLRDILQGGLSGAAASPAKAGGIGAILGGLLGGGGDSVKGALGGGALAMLASVAMKALLSRGQGTQGLTDARWSGGDLPLGLKPPANREQEQALEKTAELVLKGMINAAKSDGEISREEAQKIVGKLRESGLDDDAQQWVLAEMRRPLDLREFVAEIPNEEVAAQVYAASLLAIEVDTAAERQYLEQLAERTGLHPVVVQQIRMTMGAGA